ncbi:MAG: adenosylcobinamide-GDP ribazoletransferase [Caldilineaceae bacterium]
MSRKSRLPKARLALRLPAGLNLALGFLTTLPVSPISNEVFAALPDLPGQAFAWYPVVGVLIGVFLACAGWLLHFSALAPAVQAGLLLTGWVLLSGGLHLDGLLDTCDALFAPVAFERRLQILKDVHTGAFGVIGLVLLVGLKWALLTQLVAQQRATLWLGLWLAPIWGRWMLVWAAQRYPYARPSGAASLGSTMRQGLGARQLYSATIGALAAFFLCLVVHRTALWSLTGPLVGLLGARWAANKLNGGLTGDVYGALCEMTELFVLLGMALAS